MKMPKRQVRPVFITSCLHLGGATTFLLNLARGLKSEEVDFCIISLEAENPMKLDFLPFANKMLILDQHGKIFEDRVAEALRHLSFFRPSHVVACLGTSSLEILRYVPKGVGRIGLIQSNDPGPYCAIKNYREYLDGIGAVSLEIFNKLKRTSNLCKKILGDVRYGVGVPRLKPLQNRYSSQRPIRILYCGRVIEEQKRIGLLPRILRQLDHLKVDYRFTLAGDGPDLAKVTKALNPWTQGGKVIILGKVSQREVGKIMNLNDIYLLFSDYEGLPLSLLEAMASGLVPVVSDLGQNIRDLLHETGGQLVAMDNPKNYAYAIQKLCRRRNLFKKYRQACRNKIKKEYSLNAMKYRWLKFLKTVKSQETNVSWDQTQIVVPPVSLKRKIFYSRGLRPIRRYIKIIASRLEKFY